MQEDAGGCRRMQRDTRVSIDGLCPGLSERQLMMPWRAHGGVLSDSAGRATGSKTGLRTGPGMGSSAELIFRHNLLT